MSLLEPHKYLKELEEEEEEKDLYEPIPNLVHTPEAGDDEEEEFFHDAEETEDEEKKQEDVSPTPSPARVQRSPSSSASVQPVLLDTVQYPHFLTTSDKKNTNSNNDDDDDDDDCTLLCQQVHDEITQWTQVLHKDKPLPRLLAVQGDVEPDGVEPLYRDGLEYQPDLTGWTPIVKSLRDKVSNTVGQPLNHATICLYRHGEDYLSETSCPTLDLVPDSSICKLSLGATRTVLLRPKRWNRGQKLPSPRPTLRVKLPHGSLLRLGPQTNQFMTHEIKRHSRYYKGKEKHVASDKPEMQESDMRICITFRHVGTFQTEQGHLFGQGANAKSLQDIESTSTDTTRTFQCPATPAMKKLQSTFEKQSRHADFNVQKYYGTGHDVIPFCYIASSQRDVVDLEQETDSCYENCSVSMTDSVEESESNKPRVVSPSPVSAKVRQLEENGNTCPLFPTYNDASPQDGDSSSFHGVSPTPMDTNHGPDVDYPSVAAKVEHFEAHTSDEPDLPPSTGRTVTPTWKSYHLTDVSPETTNDKDCLVLTSSDLVDQEHTLISILDRIDENAEHDSPTDIGSLRRTHYVSPTEKKKDGFVPKSQRIFVERPEHQETLPGLGTATDTISRTISDSSMTTPGYFEEYQNMKNRSPLDKLHNGSPAMSDGTSTAPTKLSSPAKNGYNGIALLAVDLQNDFLGEDPNFFFGKLGSPIAPRRDALLSRIDELAKEVRRMGGVVIFVKSQYGAWSSPQGQNAGRISQPGAHIRKGSCCSVNSAGADFHPSVDNMIVNQDIILIKEWYSAFFGTALDRQLRRLHVGHVCVTGVTTNHSVAATIRSGSKLGYNMILSSDGTAQIDPRFQKRSEHRLRKYYSLLLGEGRLSSIVSPDPCVVVDPAKDEKGATPKPTAMIEIDAFARLSGFGSGDSIIIPCFLESKKADELYEKIRPGASSDIEWTEIPGEGSCSAFMAVQVEPNEDGHFPVYRGDVHQPWERNFKANSFTEPVGELKTLVESQTGHQLNFGRILCYRDGQECSGVDTHKLLDVKAGSFVAAVSLGGERYLELRPKKEDSSLAPQRVLLPHNGLLLIGPETTRKYIHCVPKDEKATKPHVQITFLEVATFFAQQESRQGVPALYGQGTQYADIEELQEAEATRRMVEQFGITMAGVYTLTTVAPGRGGSLGFSFISTAVVTAATAMWFHRERKQAWQQQQQRVFEYFQECIEEPFSAEESRHRILNK